MTRVYLLLSWLLACAGCEQLLTSASHTHVDDDCKAAARHLNECCANFHDGAVSCIYDDRNYGEHGDLTSGQAQCIQRTPCGAVRQAAQSYDQVCGFELRKNLMSHGVCDASAPASPVKPSEKND